MESSTPRPPINLSELAKEHLTLDSEGFIVRTEDPDWDTLEETLTQSLIDQGLIKEKATPKPVLMLVPKTDEHLK